MATATVICWAVWAATLLKQYQIVMQTIKHTSMCLYTFVYKWLNLKKLGRTDSLPAEFQIIYVDIPSGRGM